jgi:hypothetical protein
MGALPITSANLSCLGLKWHANFWEPRSGQLPVGRQTGSWQPDPITNPALFVICCLAWQLSAMKALNSPLIAESWNRGWSVVLIN